jgi:hypothetical protein
MSTIKPAANQRSSVGMMEIMGHAWAGSQEWIASVFDLIAKPLDGSCGVLFRIEENVAKRGSDGQSGVIQNGTHAQEGSPPRIKI